MINLFKSSIKDPISALTHFIGAVLSIAGCIFLIYKSIQLNNNLYLIGSFVFGLSMLLLYSASTIYHWVQKEGDIQNILRRIDHSMIYVLIAGTYTPVCILVLKGSLGLGLLIGIWTLAIAGIILKIFWLNAPRWLYTGFYVFLGWISVFFIWPIYNSMEFGGFLALLTGGILYTIGSIIYGKKSEKLSFKFFGFHEIFHLFILAGSASHFIMVNNFIIK